MKIEPQLYESEHNSIAFLLPETKTIYVKQQFYKLSKLAQRFIIEWFIAKMMSEDLTAKECDEIACDAITESFGVPLLNINVMLQTEIRPLFKK